MEWGTNAAKFDLCLKTVTEAANQISSLLQAIENCNSAKQMQVLVLWVCDDDDDLPINTSHAVRADRLDYLFGKVHQLSQLKIAMVATNNVSRAGFCLLASCDVVIATHDVKSNLADPGEATCSTVPAFLMRHLGCKVVEKWLSVGTIVTSEDAYRLGLVSELVDSIGSLKQRCEDLQKRLSGPLVVQHSTLASLHWLSRSAASRRNSICGVQNCKLLSLIHI